MLETIMSDPRRSRWIAREDSACMRRMAPRTVLIPAACFAALALIGPPAAAQGVPGATPPPPAEQSNPVRFTVDAHFGLTYRVPAGEGEDAGGVLVGGNFLV